MIDINELREKITIKGLDVVADTDILAVLDRLEAAESECLEEARLNGMGSEREAALMAKLEAAEKERDDVAWQLAQSEQGKRKISEDCDALRASLEAAESVLKDFGTTAQEVECWLERYRCLEREAEALRVDLDDHRALVSVLREESTKLRARIEAMEDDSARHKALAESALRIAKGWEDKCYALLARIEKQEPVAEWTENRFHHYPQLDWAAGYKAVIGAKLYALPGAKGEGK